MANLNITEYGDFGKGPDGTPMQAGLEPALFTDNVSFTTSTQSSAFNRKTRLVRLVSDTACYVKFGTNPTATTSTDCKLAANVVEFFCVPQGESYKVAAVT